MKSLALRIYLAVVTVLLLFALVVGWLAQRNLEHERLLFRSQNAVSDRMVAWAELIENSLPAATATDEAQREALAEWSKRLRLPMALDNAQGQRIATSPLLTQVQEKWPDASQRLQGVKLADGRRLWIMKPGPRGPKGFFWGPSPRRDMPPQSDHVLGEGGPRDMGPDGGPGPRDDHGPEGRPHPHGEPWLAPLAGLLPPAWAAGAQSLVVMLVLVFVAVALGAWPVANRLTRRLKDLREGVESFGSGQLQYRVEVEGQDEVADLARSFNEAAQRIEELVTSHRALLANASHELRSPLARMKMALSMLPDMPPDKATQLQQEIHRDIAELDSLVEEVLLASRLDARPVIDKQSVDLIGLLVEEARRTGAQVVFDPHQAQIKVQADERLLRRAVRNLLENAQRYGQSGHGAAGDVQVSVGTASGVLSIAVEDRGPGVPETQRERIFEPFYRMPGHAEHAGGVGLGLSLVRQIAQRHGGSVRCEARDGGGSRFVIALPY